MKNPASRLHTTWELRAREPMLPMRFFRSRAFAAGNAGGTPLASCCPGRSSARRSSSRSSCRRRCTTGPWAPGLRLVPWTVTLSLVAPVAGAWVNRVGERPLIVAGLLLQAAGFAWIALIAEPA